MKADKELKIHIEKIHFESFVQIEISLCQRPEHYFFAGAKSQVSSQSSAFIDITRPSIHGGGNEYRNSKTSRVECYSENLATFVFQITRLNVHVIHVARQNSFSPVKNFPMPGINKLKTVQSNEDGLIFAQWRDLTKKHTVHRSSHYLAI